MSTLEIEIDASKLADLIANELKYLEGATYGQIKVLIGKYEENQIHLMLTDKSLIVANPMSEFSSIVKITKLKT